MNPRLYAYTKVYTIAAEIQGPGGDFPVDSTLSKEFQ
jgi:hypothetical protein